MWSKIFEEKNLNCASKGTLKKKFFQKLIKISFKKTYFSKYINGTIENKFQKSEATFSKQFCPNIFLCFLC